MKKVIFLLAVALACFSAKAQEQPTFSGKMNADSIREVCSAVSGWQIDNFAKV